MAAYINLYFIAIVPPKEICDAITAFKTDMSIRFQSKQALKVVPHITLKAPFKLLSTYHASLLEWFCRLSFSQSSFEQVLDGFGIFNNPKHPVLYVKPVFSQGLLTIQKELLLSFQSEFPFVPVSGTEKNFHPHITIAYRDLSPVFFREAWAVYGRKEYKASFPVHGFYLMQHDGIVWQPIAAAAL